jgi:hypothetical protein
LEDTWRRVGYIEPSDPGPSSKDYTGDKGKKENIHEDGMMIMSPLSFMSPSAMVRVLFVELLKTSCADIGTI